MPTDYGVPKDSRDLLPWEHVTERMAKAQHYWISSVDPQGRPHATPVDGLWLDDRLYFGGSPQTRRNRNIAANAAVCVHLPDAMDVVILHGDAIELRGTPDMALARRLAEGSKKKYGFGMKAEDYYKGGAFVFTPRVVFAWSSFPKDVTKFTF